MLLLVGLAGVTGATILITRLLATIQQEQGHRAMAIARTMAQVGEGETRPPCPPCGGRGRGKGGYSPGHWPWLLVALMAVAGLGGCAPRAVDHEQVPLAARMVVRFSHVVAENTPKGLAARRFANLVRERSGGRIEAQVFANSSLFGDGEEFRALREGKVQLIAPTTAKVADLVPAWQVFDLPFLFSDEEAVVAAMNGYLGSRLLALLPEREMIGLALWDNGFKQMTNSAASTSIRSACSRSGWGPLWRARPGRS